MLRGRSGGAGGRAFVLHMANLGLTAGSPGVPYGPNPGMIFQHIARSNTWGPLGGAQKSQKEKKKKKKKILSSLRDSMGIKVIQDKQIIITTEDIINWTKMVRYSKQSSKD